MAGTLMTLVVSFLFAAVLWLIVGSRFGGCIPVAFVLVFFGIGGS
jgi:hypothetical protein